MKILEKAILLFVSVLFFSNVYSQAPQKINYQAVARDLSGVPLQNTSISIQFDIRQGSASGAVIYSETQTGLSTNQFGLFTAEIGGGTATLGNFSSINWGASISFLQITINGNLMPATQLLSVPYALHATTAASGTAGIDGLNCWDLNGNGLQDALEDINMDGSWNSLDCQGVNGANGIGINWQGTFALAPSSPNQNDAYYNSIDGISYIWDGVVWQILSQDGTSSGLTAGNGIDINTGVITNTGDLDSTNELITSAILNGTTLEITEGGVTQTVSLASLAVGDNWGSQLVNVDGTTITGDGDGTPLSGFDGDYNSLTNQPMIPTQTSDLTNNSGFITSPNDGDFDPNNEIELPATAGTNEVLTWNGSAWVAQAPGAGADNWGSQVVVTDATITGDGSITPLSGFDGQYSSLTGAPNNVSTFTNDAGYLTSFTEVDGSVTNEIQALSFTTPNLTLSSGGGTVNLSALAGTDNQDLSLSVNTLSLTNDASPVDLSVYLDNTDSQNLTYNSSTQNLSIGGGNSVILDVNDADNNVTNEIQMLSFASPNLTLSNGGGTIDLSALSGGTADNGITASGSNVSLGGALIQNTVIDAGTNSFSFESSLNGPQLDQSSLTQGCGAGGSDNTAYWQSFTAGSTADLKSIEIRFFTSFGETPTITLRTGTGTGGTVLATGTITKAAVGTWVLATTVSLTSGSVYTFQLSDGSGVRTACSNVYGGGTAGGGSFSGIDFTFQTYINTPTVITPVLYVNGGANQVGVGTSSPDQTFSVNGDASKVGGGSWATFSDRRLKKEVSSYSDGLEKILMINPKKFKYNGLAGYPDNGKEYIGVIAQEIKEVAPYMVETISKKLRKDSREETELLIYDGSALTYMLINAVKEQQIVIEQLEKRLQLLEK